MKYKLLASILIASLLMMSFTACTGNGTQTTVLDTTEQTTFEGEPETTDDTPTVIAQIPTESGGKLSQSGLIVTEFIIYERLTDGTLVKQTDMADFTITKKTVDDEEIYVGEYNVDGQTDYVSFALTCTLNDQAGIAVGRVFNKTDGDSVLDIKYLDKDGQVLPLQISIDF